MFVERCVSLEWHNSLYILMHSQFIRFVGVGTVATLIQYAVLIVLKENQIAGAVMASTIGYIISGVFNYLLNYYFTFRSSEKHMAAAIKFTVVALIGLGLNGLFMYLSVEIIGLYYLLGQLITTSIVLIWNFTVNRYWTYRAGLG